MYQLITIYKKIINIIKNEIHELFSSRLGSSIEMKDLFCQYMSKPNFRFRSGLQNFKESSFMCHDRQTMDFIKNN